LARAFLHGAEGNEDLEPYASAYRELADACGREEPRLVLDQFGGLIVAAQYRYLYDVAIRHVPAAGRVLDWGCGDGHFSHFLLGRGYRVDSFSIQNAPPLFARLPQSWRARHVVTQGSPAEPTRLPYADATFDSVFSVGVLEHVRETGGSEIASLRELHRILRPGGRLICGHLPNRSSYIEWASRRLFRDAPDDAHRRYHLYRFSKNEASRLLAEAGFTIESIRPYGFLPRNVLGRLPARVRDNPAVTRFANAADRILETVFAPMDQNHLVVALKARDIEFPRVRACPGCLGRP
jgi:SAM-dependent methyltransferase